MHAPTSSFGLYVHVPFCRRRCTYCDFLVAGNGASDAGVYTAALVCEIERLRPELVSSDAPGGARTVTSVFFGGGTPSVLPLEELGQVAAALRRTARFAGDAEWTVEANPESATPDWMAGARALGFNRLSLGVQSFAPEALALLGRLHSADEARAALRRARAAGYGSVSLDLIYGLPNQTPAHWAADLEDALALEPDHLSLYALSLDPAVPLAARVRRGDVTLPADDRVAELYEAACARLAREGWEHYEISNWARPGQRCRHNLGYWRRGEYAGVGLGAHSHLAGRRFHGPRELARYLAVYRQADGPRARDEVEILTEEQQLSEAMFLGLRLAEGVRLAPLRETFGENPVREAAAVLDGFVAPGYVRRDGDCYTLTDRGRLVSDAIFCRFVRGANR